MGALNLAQEFPLRDGLIYLNHAAVAPWPARTMSAVQAFAAENCMQGAVDYERWLTVEAELRGRLQRLINAPSSADIALLKNTSEALSFVAYGLQWRSGDNVVISNQEFPSNRVVWESLRRLGVEVREADIGGEDPEAALIARCDVRTRLLSISSIQYATGLRMDLARLGRFCRGEGVLFCVDAIQSLGAINLDVQAIAADFVMADGHKWMLGPEGIAVFYVRPEVRETLELHEYGWHMVALPSDYDRRDWTVAASARRFECGSPNMLGIHALNASLALLEEVGFSEIERQVMAKTADLADRLDAAGGFDVITPRHRRGGIITFRSRSEETDALFQRLKHAGVVCAVRGGGIRYAPHFYTPTTQLHAAVRLASGAT